MIGASTAPGFLNGLVVPDTSVVSLFDGSVGGYETHNSGHPYDLGFVLGAGRLARPGIFARRA